MPTDLRQELVIFGGDNLETCVIVPTIFAVEGVDEMTDLLNNEVFAKSFWVGVDVKHLVFLS